MFFDNPTVTNISQGHIDKLMTLEEDRAQKLLKDLRRVKLELLDRLISIPDGTYSEQANRVTLAQVESMIQALSERLKSNMNEYALDVGKLSISHLEKEVTAFSREFEGSVQPINLDAVLLAEDTSNFLINQHEASIDAYSAGLRQQITQGLTEAIIARSPMSQVTSKLGKFFSAELQWKIPMIARTELHNMYGKAKLQGMRETQDQYIPDLKKTLFHPMDKRTGDDSKTAERLNLIVDIDKPFRYSFRQGKKTIERVFMTPPDRPNDRSILIPYRKSWDQ
jgi:hypothetical protein